MSDTVASPERLAHVADEAASEAADYLADRFDNGPLDAEYTAMDVKTEADVGAEERILSVISGAYPDHAIEAEESGAHPGDGAYRWVVDPLDGTNNFAIGLPTFAVGVTALEVTSGPDDTDEPVATSIHVPVLSESYVARRGGGVSHESETVTVADGDGVPTSHATVGCIIGEPVLTSQALQADHAAITDAVESECKRVIQTWAPLVYWGLLARGGLDGFVCFHPDEREQAAGSLLAREADCVERGDGPLSVFAADHDTADALWKAATAALE